MPRLTTRASLRPSASLPLADLRDVPVVDGSGAEVPGLSHCSVLARAVVHHGDLHDSYVRMWHLMHPADELRRLSVVVDRVRSLAFGATFKMGNRG